MLRRISLIAAGLLSLLLLIACQDDTAKTFKGQVPVAVSIISPTPEAVDGRTLNATPEVVDDRTSHVTPEASETTGTKGDLMGALKEDISKEFYYEELSEQVIDRIQGKSYKKNCDIPYDELRYVRVLYCGFDGEDHRGEMIVNKAIAKDTVEIFRELYEKQYPIERMVLVDDYDADDNTSMAADNTSCFNYRNVDGTKRLSLHSHGLAIDINPLYNPYVHTLDGKEVVTPKEGEKYADRSLSCPYFIDEKDVCYQIFKKHGFTWGGDWANSKDYQHFQKKLD